MSLQNYMNSSANITKKKNYTGTLDDYSGDLQNYFASQKQENQVAMNNLFNQKYGLNNDNSLNEYNKLLTDNQIISNTLKQYNNIQENKNQSLAEQGILSEQSKAYMDNQAKINGTAGVGTTESSRIGALNNYNRNVSEINNNANNQERALLDNYNNAMIENQKDYNSRQLSEISNNQKIKYNTLASYLENMTPSNQGSVKSNISKALNNGEITQSQYNNLLENYNMIINDNDYINGYGANLPQGAIENSDGTISYNGFDLPFEIANNPTELNKYISYLQQYSNSNNNEKLKEDIFGYTNLSNKQKAEIDNNIEKLIQNNENVNFKMSSVDYNRSGYPDAININVGDKDFKVKTFGVTKSNKNKVKIMNTGTKLSEYVYYFKDNLYYYDSEHDLLFGIKSSKGQEDEIIYALKRTGKIN